MSATGTDDRRRRMEGDVALIVGAASGLGRASARACADDGARIAVADIDEERGNQVVASLAASGTDAAYVPIDVTDEARVADAVASVVERFGKLTVLVNSAGRAFLDGDDRWDRTVGLFLRGSHLTSKHALPAIASAGGGAVVNIASLAGMTGSVQPKESEVLDTGYAVAKHGVVGLTRSLALAYVDDGIRVNAVCPGFMRTEITREMWEDPETSRQVIAGLGVPMGRWGEPDEVGRTVAFLAGSDAAFITGQTIVVDGGLFAA